MHILHGKWQFLLKSEIDAHFLQITFPLHAHIHLKNLLIERV